MSTKVAMNEIGLSSIPQSRCNKHRSPTWMCWKLLATLQYHPYSVKAAIPQVFVTDTIIQATHIAPHHAGFLATRYLK